MKVLFTIPFFLIFSLSLFGQHHTIEKTYDHKESHFRVSVALAHTILPEHTGEGKKSLVLPSFGLDIEYWVKHHWGIGLHNDLELLNFEVETHEGVFIEREYPLLMTIDALWKPKESLVLFFGPGVELERNENYLLFRMGMEYEFDLGPHWDFAPIFFYDVRNGAYNTFSIGLGVGYTFN